MDVLVKAKLYSIKWDVDADSEDEYLEIVSEIGLPDEVIFEEQLSEEDLKMDLDEIFADYLSDRFEYCVSSFAFKIIGVIAWDIPSLEKK